MGVDQPAYLEAQIDIGIAASDINGGTWELTTRPAASAAAITNSPLGASVSVFERSDLSVVQAAPRALLRPDVAGEYVVTVTTGSKGTPSVAQAFIASDYTGIQPCSVRHGGGLAAALVLSWSQTLHASMFPARQHVQGRDNGSQGVLVSQGRLTAATLWDTM